MHAFILLHPVPLSDRPRESFFLEAMPEKPIDLALILHFPGVFVRRLDLADLLYALIDF